ncbi:AEC family transporter [Moraxella bovis]|uniref:AEC family transporter n=1 Tax=Moraxella bovis TaxID=476 RepID=A0AAQ2T074_MORBO|nr:AEC family transporter [Moraxella bovis]UYZ76986.1 AEC family transporter [Moraxella bovis]UYZ79671.1 AEC family transporter [Moraxella bovis]UYZ88157.1 AEC family transporter [Moraxella bovis]UYZ93576.1 AEC family transporter [Moraxella bovis]UYZ99101.1 AEC family transporter [Moraxella bovis]
MLQAISFAFMIVFPNLALMGLGFYMRKSGKINSNFIDTASKIVFNFGLPCLLFFSVIKSEVNYAEQLPLIMAGFVTTFVLFFGAELYAKMLIKDVRDKGVFVQGVFRSNMAIISLSVATNAYGAVGTSVGAVYIGILTILYNILSVITLSRTSQSKGLSAQSRDIIIKIFQNPLIIALVSAFIYKGVGLPLPPTPIAKTGQLLSNIALPLALICAGATLDIKSMLGLSGVSMQASIGWIIVAPLLAVGVGVAFALPPVQFGVLFVMVASPAAAASYVMAKAMGGNDVLAANILAFTTVVSMIGMAVGIAWLRVLGWV